MIDGRPDGRPDRRTDNTAKQYVSPIHEGRHKTEEYLFQHYKKVFVFPTFNDIQDFNNNFIFNKMKESTKALPLTKIIQISIINNVYSNKRSNNILILEKPAKAEEEDFFHNRMFEILASNLIPLNACTCLILFLTK